MGIFDGPEEKSFSWPMLGDIKLGRTNLGEEMPVIVYRLMQFTLMDVLRKEYGKKVMDDNFRSAGYLAGSEFAKNVLKLDLEFDAFISHLQETLNVFKIGILRIEQADLITGKLVLTISEDLDCSGLPVTNENVCVYDEGFVAGILDAYTKKKYEVREVDCWASGDRTCRFEAVPLA